MKERVSRMLARLRGTLRPKRSAARIQALERRVIELEASLDELRRDSLRVAELIDVAEQMLTPGRVIEAEARD